MAPGTVRTNLEYDLRGKRQHSRASLQSHNLRSRSPRRRLRRRRRRSTGRAATAATFRRRQLLPLRWRLRERRAARGARAD